MKGGRGFDLGLPKIDASHGWNIGQAIQRTVATSWQRRQMEMEREQERRRQEALLNSPPPLHGSAQWATASELAGAGYLRPADAFEHPSSIVLGVVPDPRQAGHIRGQIHWDGEGHLLTVAPTRSGKSTTTIVPNLLRYRGSCVVLDPKGELYRDTSTWRGQEVGPVYRIAPFSNDSAGFNPLLALRRPSDARELAEILIPDDPHASDFFKNDAVTFLSALIWFVASSAPLSYRHLPEIRRLTANSMEEFRDVVRRMTESSDPAIRHPAEIVLSKDAEKAIRTLRDTLSGHLSFLDDPGIARALSQNDVDFQALKERPTTVYISIPFNKMSAFAPFLKVLLTTALEAMIANEHQPKIPVLFILDEFLSLKSFPKFRDAIRTHAGAGVRLWFFLQDIPTLEEYYPTSWKAFFNASVKQFFGTDDGFTGELISEWLGDKTVAYQSSSLSANHSISTGPVFDREGNRGSTLNHSVAFTGRPLLTPDEVVRLLSGPLPDKTRHGITFLRGVNPIQARLVPWFLGEICKQRVRPPMSGS